MMILDMKKKLTSKGKFLKNIFHTSISHILKKIFYRNKTIKGEKYQLQKWEKIKEDSDGKKWKKIVVKRRFPDSRYSSHNPAVWYKIQDVFEDDKNVFHKETTTQDVEELPTLKTLWEKTFQEEGFIIEKSN